MIERTDEKTDARLRYAKDHGPVVVASTLLLVHQSLKNVGTRRTLDVLVMDGATHREVQPIHAEVHAVGVHAVERDILVMVVHRVIIHEEEEGGVETDDVDAEDGWDDD